MIRWLIGYLRFSLVGILLIFGISCENDIAVTNNDTVPSNFSDVFELFWYRMNTNYVYWDIDTTNWDSMYDRYGVIFSKLDLNDDEDVKSSVKYFKQITNGLVDSHYYITFHKSIIKDSIVNPAYDRKIEKSDFHPMYPYAVLDASYLDEGFVAGYDSSSEPNSLKYALSGLIDNSILFFYCNEFSLFQSYHSTRPNGVQPVLNYFFKYINMLPSNVKGIIIDTRGNHGGYLNDLDFFVGRLIKSPLTFGWTRYRIGNGRLDYTPWVEATVTPVNGSSGLDVPIIVLADNFTRSLAETITMAISALPNGIFVGETTWGATGQVAPTEIYNSGPFTIPNFMSVHTSSVEFKYIDGNVYEGRGFAPDVFVPYERDSVMIGIDGQLERAISLILE